MKAERGRRAGHGRQEPPSTRDSRKNYAILNEEERNDPHPPRAVAWYIGQTLRGFSREHRQRRVLERLEEIAVARDADAFVITDVFDYQNPSG